MPEQPEGTKAAQNAPLEGHVLCEDCERTLSKSWSFCPSCGTLQPHAMDAADEEVAADA